MVLAVQGAVEDRGRGVRTRGDGRVVDRAHVFRGKVLSFGRSEHRHNQLPTFLPRPTLRASDVVLPDGVLTSVERHVVRTDEQTAALQAHGQHLKRGLPLYGPPGTGKTHTVRYLLSRQPDCTVFLLSGVAAIRFLRATTTLARRLGAVRGGRGGRRPGRAGAVAGRRRAALGELLDERQALTRSIIGG